jgi:hypothetical protein
MMKVIIRGLWDRLGGWLLIAVGALAVIIGWIGVSGVAYTSEQMPYIVSGGLGGLALIGTGATLLISSDLRDEWRKLDDIERAIRSLPAQEATAADTAILDSGSKPVRRRRSSPIRVDNR